jgi:arylsulfatase
MLVGETHGRRDYVFIYSINSLKAVVKEQYKLSVPGPGESPIVAKFYDLFRDTREEWPVSTEVGAWGGQEFARMIQRHMMRKQKYPDEGPAMGRPYDGIENLRPESKAAVEAFLFKQGSPAK